MQSQTKLHKTNKIPNSVMKENPNSKSAIKFRNIVAIICILIPIYIAGDSANHRYQASKQSVYTHQFWIPANAEVLKDSAEWDKKVPGGDVQMVNNFQQYKEKLAGEKHLILFRGTMATYATTHGKMVIMSVDNTDPTPASTNIKEVKYLGDGKMEYRLERDNVSLIVVPVFKGVLLGILLDIVIGVVAYILYRAYTEIRDGFKKKQKEQIPETVVK